MKVKDNNEIVISLNNITKTFKKNKNNIRALNEINLKFKKGKFYAIMGHSGSGKSTLINIIGMLDEITSGEYKINGIDINNLSENEKIELRKNNIGFIFQDYLLDPYLKAYENIMLPMYLNNKINNVERKKLAFDLLKEVDLENRAEHFPKELSGGEQQRVAIARALANNPNIILADEPTGNLDEQSEKKILNILKKLSEMGKCVIVVSHSNEILEYADEVFVLKDGKLVGDE